jgi:rhodanese-related sulfurtransferase
MRSLRVVNFLRGNGFDNAVNLDGGIDAWAAQIEPAVGRY